MRIWHLDFDVDNYNNLTLTDEEDWENLDFDGTMKRNTWSPMKIKMIGDKQLSDATCLNLITGIPVFNNKAIEVLNNLLKSNIEILPLRYNKEELYAINVTKVLNCIDYDKSIYIKFKSSGRIMVFEEYAFKEECVEGNHIFKIIDEPKRGAFVSDEFRNEVLKSGLTGFKFELAWKSTA